MKLQLATDLALPLEAVTEVLAFLGRRGQGKSYAAQRLAELFYERGAQFVVVDPVGSWYGLRSSSDGKGPGLPIPIFGGRHGDVPLEKTGGPLVADLVVGERLSAVLDVSELSEGDKTRFLIDFAERLYRTNQDPLHLFLEEADDYIPQRPFHEQARLLRAFENIVRRGRARGLGITLITQRSAALNKNVLTQVETLCVLRTTSPQDRKAIEGWVEYHGQKRELLESLSGLEAGEAWIWSPSWLRLTERVHVRRRRTFDSGATPKDLRGSRAPGTVADVDLAAITKRMAATIERAKAEDPRELRRQLQEAKRELASARAAVPVAPPPPAPKERRVEIPVLKTADLTRIEKLVERTDAAADKALSLSTALEAQARPIREALAQLRNGGAPKSVPRGVQQRPVLSQVPPRAAVAPRRQQASAPLDDLSRSQQRILNALAWLESVGVPQADKTQVALLADQSPTSGGYFNNLGVLRTAGLIGYPQPTIVQLTDAGRGAAEPVDVPQTSAELHRQLFARLSASQVKILEALIGAYPEEIAKPDLAEQAGQSATSGGYFNNLGRLRSLGLIDYPRPGYAAALPVLFLEGA